MESNRKNTYISTTVKTVNTLTYRFVTGKDAFSKYQRGDLQTAPCCHVLTMSYKQLELIQKNVVLEMTNITNKKN